MKVGKVIKKVKAPQRQIKKAGETAPKGIPVHIPKPQTVPAGA